MINQIDIKQLYAVDKEKIVNHLIGLSSESRFNRFCAHFSDEAIKNYVEKIDFHHDGVFGVFNDNLDLIAFAHVPISKKSAEIGISVNDQYQGQKIGTVLLKRINLFAKAHDINELYLYCVPENKKMMHLANKFNLIIKPYEDCGVINLEDKNLFDVIEDNILTSTSELLHSQKMILKSIFKMR